MTFRQFAFNNVIRNKRVYLAHFLSSSFSVFVFFVYALLLFHPDLQGELRSTSRTISALATDGMRLSQVILFIFSFFFCLYSAGTFLQTRKREFGILMMHGMSPRQLRRLVFIENLFIGGASIAAGIAVGLIFTKMILLGIAKLLVIKVGLTFYMPVLAIVTTAAAFALLFGVVALVTSRIVKAGRLADLFRSDEKPKPEPKPSRLLSVLAIVLILAGYGVVMVYVYRYFHSFWLLFAGVGLVVAGTYFLFTQFSVYALRSLKRKDRVFFKRTNLLVLSQLAYRMKDNATMFFMITIVSAIAFTGIGTVLATNHPGLKEMENPYAFTYKMDLSVQKETGVVPLIKKQLADHGFAYDLNVVHAKRLWGRLILVKQSEFNALAKTLGLRDTEELAEGESLLLPGSLFLATQIKEKKEIVPDSIDLGISETWQKNVTVKQYVPTVILPDGHYTVVVSDRMFETVPEIENTQLQFNFFYVADWQNTRDVASALAEEIGKNEFDRFAFDALVLDWLSDKQTNGLLFIISAMVGVVFFTFAASLLYFRLYADMERDREQYRMIAKMGLLNKELRRIVTRQLLLMFFLPIVLALVHSGVAFIALQHLVDFSVWMNSVLIFLSFIGIQIVYFFLIRWRYLQHMYPKNG
ncbi:FtsX-like permease family protein [Paenibacillus chitinolyticus]|uniref:FtsX-like permease family protein n=1 Tax=Paenibacillus chitinolyticus TaxID=79263 RepID=UPI00366CB42B